MLLSPTFLCSRTIDYPAHARMHRRQLLIAATTTTKKRDCNPVWEPKNSCMHLHCFVGGEAEQDHLGVQIDGVICIWSVKKKAGVVDYLGLVSKSQDYLHGGS